MQKFIFIFCITFFLACNSSNKSAPTSADRIEIDDASIKENTANEIPVTVSDFEEKKPVFEASVEEQSKYLYLKKEVTAQKEIFRKNVYPIAPRNIQALRSTTSGTLKEMAETIEHYAINEYITMRQIDNVQFNRELKQVGTALSYCMIKDFGNSKDQSKLLNIKSKIQQLNTMNLISDFPILQAKLFEAELNSKATFTDPNMKIKIGDDGKVYINQ